MSGRGSTESPGTVVDTPLRLFGVETVHLYLTRTLSQLVSGKSSWSPVSTTTPVWTFPTGRDRYYDDVPME